MHRLHMKHAVSRRQRGITLIESLVAIVVAALGILGIVGVQMRTLADTSTSLRRAQAIRLIEDLGERMRTNPSALANLNAYVANFAASPSVGSCASGCNLTQQAAYDLAVWKKAVGDTLPAGKVSIFVPPAESGLAAGQGRQLGVMIAWRENERYEPNPVAAIAYKQNIDATMVHDSSGNLISGGGTTTGTDICPADHTCHLQYIPVSSRCAPYAPGSAATMYVCPGA